MRACGAASSFRCVAARRRRDLRRERRRSEEHTSELQSPCNLVCRLLLEKKKNSNCIPLLEYVVYPSSYAHPRRKPTAGDFATPHLPRTAHLCSGVSYGHNTGTCISYLSA